MIDLAATKRVVEQCTDLIQHLDGERLDEMDALITQSKGAARQRRAELSQELQLLATRFELAAQLVRNEYWFARGEEDPVNPGRTDPR